MGSGWRAAALALQFGFVVAAMLAGGAWVGRMLDIWLGTKALFLIIGVLLGLASSLYLLYFLYRLQVRR